MPIKDSAHKTYAQEISGNRQEKTESGDFVNECSKLIERTEHWLDVCAFWAERPASQKTLDEALPILDQALHQNEASAPFSPSLNGAQKIYATNMQSRSIQVDRNGKILSIGDIAKERLGLKKGDKIQGALDEKFKHILDQADSGDTKAALIDIRGKNDVRCLCRTMRLSKSPESAPQLVLVLHETTLPAPVASYLREKIGLTKAEIDIVSRSARRQDIDTIARERGNSVNTIRTHIRKITSKFGSRTYADAITRTYELICCHTATQADEFALTKQKTNDNHIVKLSVSGKSPTIEYARYGGLDGKPLLLLHSVEYGYAPSPEFLVEAKRRGYTVYAPLRPGFGRSTPTSSQAEAADWLNAFIENLDLQQVTVVALSTAAPTAILLDRINDAIQSIILVNYSLDTDNKISNLKPVWLRGLLDFCLTSQSSFGIALNLTRRTFHFLGHQKFYEQLYQGCSDDLAFLENYPEIMGNGASIMFAADPESLRADIRNSLTSEFSQALATRPKASVLCIRGANTHGVSVTPTKRAADRLGYPLSVIPNTGRNCTFHEPAMFFETIEQHSAPKTV